MTELVIIGNTNPIEFHLDVPIENPESRLTVGLKKIAFSYSIPNVDYRNNVFRYTIDGIEWLDIHIDQGAYQIESIILFIKNRVWAKTKINPTQLYKIRADSGSMRSKVIIFKETFQIDFSCKNSVGSIFGFNSLLKYQNEKEHVSENIVMVTTVTSILVHCNLINGGVINGIRSQILYEFSPDEEYGYLLDKEQAMPHYYNICEKRIDKIKVWFTDQNLQELNMNNEEVVLRLELQ